MRDFIAFCTLMACIVVLTISIIAVFKPLPKLKLGNRKQALKGVGVACVLFVLTAIVIPEPEKPDQLDKNTATKNVSDGNQKVAAAASAPAVELSPKQDQVVSFMRNIILQSIGCKGDIDQTQRQIDKMASGTARPIDAYEAAKQGIKSCGDAIAEFKNKDVLDRIPLANHDIARRAVNDCLKAAEKRKKALQTAQQVLDGDDSLASASKYRELRKDAMNDESICRMNLMGLAEALKIPDSEVDFASADNAWK